MNHESTFSEDDIAGLPARALTSLTHAFRREPPSRPSPRERARVERERTGQRRFVDTRPRAWRIDD